MPKDAEDNNIKHAAHLRALHFVLVTIVVVVIGGIEKQAPLIRGVHYFFQVSTLGQGKLYPVSRCSGQARHSHSSITLLSRSCSRCWGQVLTPLTWPRPR